MFNRSAAIVARSSARQMARRPLSTKEVKFHKAKDHWAALKAKRPIDEDDTHLVFHPPFSPFVIFTLVGASVVIGVGSMCVGVAHQQYKQGYWK